MNKKNEYRVVKILDSKNIIINAGLNDGTNIGDEFEIVGKGIEIKMPETEESLGYLENIKDTVTAIKVFDKMCICCHIEQTPSLLSLTSQMTDIYSSKKHKKILNVSQDQMSLEDSQDKTIYENDIVRKKTSLEDFKSTND